MTAVNDLAAALAKIAHKLADALENIQQGKTPADTYAQAIAYGMFVGRLHGQTLPNIWNTLPHLSVSEDVACWHDHPNIQPILDEIDGFLQSADLELLKHDIRTAVQTDDAAIHFYEHFLAAYDPQQRKQRGVFYTPLPVVRYIVQAVDDILCQEFQLQEGLADHSKIVHEGKMIHRVQILEPAMGTGTFLAEAVRQIHSHYIKNQSNKPWNDYVAEDLLPRLHGFEILMVPYLTAHFKLALLFGETGLSPHHVADFHLANVLETEIQPAPPMVVLGNPPYNVATTNKGDFSKQLIKKYKENLGETKMNLDDDYIKFIALGQQFIEQHPLNEGIVAYITNNSFLEGITHRQMRRSLLKTFNKIYILNLHGDVRRKKHTVKGSKDENIFNIKQGTSINFFIKSPKKKKGESCKVFYADLFGKRSEKYQFLNTQFLSTSGFTEMTPAKSNYFFVPKDLSEERKYKQGFRVSELFVLYNSGIKTDRDSLFVDDDQSQLAERCQKLLTGNYDETFRKTYRIEDSHSYKITKLIQGKCFDPSCVCRVCYRPFDDRWIYYDPSVISRPGRRVMRLMQSPDNIALLTSRLIPTNHGFYHVFVTNILADGHVIGDQTYVFPLYLNKTAEREQINLNMVVVDKIADLIGGHPTALEVFDYVYGMLHDRTYCCQYQEFLKIDFPRVPYPPHTEWFHRYSKEGTRLRMLHLGKEIPRIRTAFPVQGNNLIERIRFVDNKVFINTMQYFDGVPTSVWELFIGDYRPAQKYLKDRKGHTLSWDEISHYQKIIALLDADEINGDSDNV